MSYTYNFPRPSVTVDIVLIKKNNQILLIKRKNDPFKECWALPGGFVDEMEDLPAAAKRELLEETSINLENLTQFGAYGKPNRDPRGHTVSIIYYAIIDYEIKGKAGDDAKEIKWFSISNLPTLAFDHEDIVQDFLEKKQPQ